jgi:hypothetical protein
MIIDDEVEETQKELWVILKILSTLPIALLVLIILDQLGWI